MEDVFEKAKVLSSRVNKAPSFSLLRVVHEWRCLIERLRLAANFVRVGAAESSKGGTSESFKGGPRGVCLSSVYTGERQGMHTLYKYKSDPEHIHAQSKADLDPEVDLMVNRI